MPSGVAVRVKNDASCFEGASFFCFKEVTIRTERFYSDNDFTFYCENGDGDRLTFLRGESEAFKDVYEDTFRYMINFDGRKEEVNGETRYYDYYYDQNGANQMAKEGQNWKEILNFFYQDISIDDMSKL